MSYATATAPTRASSSLVQIGTKPAHDLVLAMASHRAAGLFLQSLDHPKTLRLAALRRSLVVQYGPDAGRKFDEELKELRRQRGRAENQERLDAARLVVANDLARQGVEYLRAAVAQNVDAGALGDTGRDVGCGIAGGATAILALVGGVYTAGVAAPVIGGAGGMAMTAAGCGAQAQAQAQQTAQQAAAAAQAVTDAANARLAAENAANEAAAAEQRRKLVTVGVIGGVALLLMGTGYAIIKA